MDERKSYIKGITNGFVGSMALMLLGISIIIGAGIISVKGCWDQDLSWYYQITRQIESPDKKYIAVCYSRWVGSNTDVSFDVIDIHASDYNFDPSLSIRNNNYEFYIESHHDVDFKWLNSSTAQISYKSTDEPLHSLQKSFNDDKTVKINYKIISN